MDELSFFTFFVKEDITRLQLFSLQGKCDRRGDGEQLSHGEDEIVGSIIDWPIVFIASLLRSRYLGCHALPPTNGCSHPSNIPLPLCLWFVCSLLNRPITKQQSANDVAFARKCDVADDPASVLISWRRKHLKKSWMKA